MNTSAKVCGQCGVAGCQCGQELAGEVRRGRRMARRSYRPARRVASAQRPARRRRRRLPRWMVGRPWWMRRTRPRPRPIVSPPPLGGYAPDEPPAEPAPVEEPIEDAAGQPASEPAVEPVEQPMPDDNSAGGEPAAGGEPVADGEPTAGGEEELGAWIRRAAAAAIRAAAPRPIATATSSGAPPRPDWQVIKGGRAGGGGGGGGGGGSRDPIRAVLHRARFHVFQARHQAQQNLDLDAAALELTRARQAVERGATLTAAREYFAPVVSAIARVHSRLMIRVPFLNATSVQQYVDVLDGLLARLDGLSRQRP